MFNPLCILLITSICWQHVASRHIVQQPYYSPYSDYSYTYSGPGPFHQPYQQHHASYFSPPGTYFDQRQGILRPFPGGGVPVLVDYHKRCSENFVGLKAHPEQQQYYYVCKPDSVIFGKCQNLQIFNATSCQCVQHPPPEYIPTCTGVGRFPLFSDCHLYFKCGEDLQPKIYSCPASMIFSPASKKCINGNKCIPTQISPKSSYIPEICNNKFPPCFENGIFRSPSDCSLYYKCDLKKNGVYMQTRLKCPEGNFYDLQKKKCLPVKEVPCDCIQVAELVYPKPNALPFQPAVYPAQFDLDAMIDGQYPLEQTSDSITEKSNNCNTEENVGTTAPVDLNNELMKQDDLQSSVLSDYLNIGEQDDKAQSKEEDELTPEPNDLVISSEETASTEGSGFEPDSEELIQVKNTIEDTFTAVTAGKTEELTDLGTTIEPNEEITDECQTPIEEQPLTTDGENLEEVEATITTAVPKETEPQETTTNRVSSRSIEPEDCENLIENKETDDADTQIKHSSQTKTKQCLTKHTPTNLNTVAESKITTIKPENLNEQNSTTLTLATTTTQIPTTKLTTTTENLVTTEITNETSTTITERDNFEENLLDSALSMETAEATQSSEKTTIEIEQTTQASETNFKNPDTEDHMTTSLDTSQVVHTRSVDTNSLDEDISYEDILESEITKKPKADFLEPQLNTELESEPELDQPVNNETDLKNLVKEKSTSRPSAKTLDNREIQEIEQILESQTTTVTSPEETSIKSDSTTPNMGLLFKGTTEQTTDIPMDDEDDESSVLDSEIKVNGFETVIQPQESLEENPLLNEELLPLAKKSSDLATKENISTNEKSVTLRQIDFSGEDFIPVKSKNSKLNEIEHDDSILEKGFDDDYTTILAEREIATTLSPTIANEEITKEKQNNKIALFDKFTTLRRRQTSFNETTTQISMVAEALTSVTEQPTKNNTEEETSLNDEESDELGVLDSEIVIQGQDNNKEEEEVSNNEITSAETIQTTTNSNQQKQFSHSPSFTTLKTTTRTPTISNSTKTTICEPSEKQTNKLFLHIREEDIKQQPSPLDSSPTRKSLYYILKTKPVINNNNSNQNKTNNILVTATQGSDSDSGEIPRLEIIAERPIDIRLSICPPTCDKDHKHNKSTTGRRAVLLKWFARKSKQTIGFETGNEVNTEDD